MISVDSITSPNPNATIVIPVYNHAKQVVEVAQKALTLGLPVFVVDDGSTDGTLEKLQPLSGNLTILRHRVNLGKGAALLTGFKAAVSVAKWAITIDADGQHDPNDAKKLLEILQHYTGRENHRKRPIIVGRRMGMETVHTPWTSRFGRKFSNFWVFISGGPWLSDTQTGFRIYPLPETLLFGVKARRYQFEVEVLVKASWYGHPIVEVNVPIHYPPKGERQSHFRPFVDFCRNSGTFTRLITQRLLVPPSRRCERRDV